MNTRTFGKKNVKVVPRERKVVDKSTPTPVVADDTAHNIAVLKSWARDLWPVAAVVGAGLCALVIVAAATSPSYEDKLAAQAKDIVRSLLRDPDSARFMNVEVEPGLISGVDWTIQGCVKGRNGFGGYADWQGFYGTVINGTLNVGMSTIPDC